MTALHRTGGARTSSLRRIDKLRRLVAALAEGPLGPSAAAQLLEVSDRAARLYLDDLAAAGVGVYARGWRCMLHLHPDPAVVDAYLAHAGAAGEGAGQPCARRKALARDPLVAALFGVAGRAEGRTGAAADA